MKQNSRIQLENTLIGASAFFPCTFILSFLPELGLANRVGILLEMGHGTACLFCRALHPDLQLWKRKRAAWNIAVLLLFLSFYANLADSTFFAFVSSVSPGRSRIISASPVFSEGLLPV